TDNGAMIAFAGALRLQAMPEPAQQPASSFTVNARWNLEMLETPEAD
ncbi:MAG: tRNA (adenosine(37)-N6)-threonylcarbamoyltransferase complex transferase subunit TsaD, partial [Proteobacteria bacterium]|nr:tRNA (adenosine(37)-N6)-threonylcarbamoyltransferase complex transferase subunit TsaD [Pseudomonadota bacterium]